MSRPSHQLCYKPIIIKRKLLYLIADENVLCTCEYVFICFEFFASMVAKFATIYATGTFYGVYFGADLSIETVNTEI